MILFVNFFSILPLKHYVEVYSYTKDDLVIIISKLRDKLFAIVKSVSNDENSEPPVEILPETNEIFFDVEAGRQIVFTKNGIILDGKIELNKVIN
ncbi:MAG: hypothetical protein HQK53_13635 [Oligoflexia bacterium]|nr:hypothetical protein [Oligoflexia bacterium]